MPTLTATPPLIVVDNTIGKTSGASEVEYSKFLDEELWERLPGATWTLFNPRLQTTNGDEEHGKYGVQLKPGLVYEAGIFEPEHGPLTTDPVRIATLLIHCLWKKPANVNLITDSGGDAGGTWLRHKVVTNVPTSIVMVGASQDPIPLDADGLPQLKTPVGALITPLSTGTSHTVEIEPLPPGNHFFLLFLVADAVGNWDMRITDLFTLRRKVRVEFKTLHIFNDGDYATPGEGSFDFRVYEANDIPTVFHRNQQAIDDWGETDRPYPISFVYTSGPRALEVGKDGVHVQSSGIENDDPWADDTASTFPKALPIPVGRNKETVTNAFLRLDCQDYDAFHYGVDVFWSVEYVP